jgi:tetratricopeptide (TPR) repeat protein
MPRPGLLPGTALALCLALLAGCGATRPTSKDDALAWQDYYVAKKPSPDNFLGRAWERERRGMTDGAIADLDECLRRDELRGRDRLSNAKPFQVYAFRARLRLEKGDKEAAESDLDLAARPFGGSRSKMLAELLPWEQTYILIELGQLDDAEQVAADMLAMPPASAVFDEGIRQMRLIYAARARSADQRQRDGATP